MMRSTGAVKSIGSIICEALLRSIIARSIVDCIGCEFAVFIAGIILVEWVVETIALSSSHQNLTQKFIESLLEYIQQSINFCTLSVFTHY